MTRMQYHPLKARLLHVLQVEALSPRLRRITLSGPELDGFLSPMPDDHVKLLFPHEGAVLPVLPSFGSNGASFPVGTLRPVARDYTPRHHDPERRTLTLDFVLHGDGPASQWAANAKPGDAIGVAGPRASRLIDRQAFKHWLLLGDETALPALARWLAWIPPQARVTVCVEVASLEDRLALPAHAGADLNWVVRRLPSQGCALLAALQELPRHASSAWDVESSYAWIACESTQMRGLRQHLLNERAWPREQLYAAGYWKRGDSDHDDEH